MCCNVVLKVQEYQSVGVLNTITEVNLENKYFLFFRRVQFQFSTLQCAGYARHFDLHQANSKIKLDVNYLTSS